MLRSSPILIIHGNPEKEIDDYAQKAHSKQETHKQILQVFTGILSADILKFTKKKPAHVQSGRNKRTYAEGPYLVRAKFHCPNMPYCSCSYS